MTVSTVRICCSILLLWDTIRILAFSLSRSSYKQQFGATSSSLAQQHHDVFRLSLSSSSSSSASAVESEVYPPLSRDEIEIVLGDIPVYAVSSSKNDDGIVMLNEKDNENPIAYFFFNPTTANEVYKGLSKNSKQSDDEWRITQFPLSLIWFELMKFDKSTGRAVFDGVEYRLRPDRDQLQGARDVLSAIVKSTQGLSEKDDVPDTFLATYNEIPVFLDPRMRLVGDDDIEQFPMYLSLQDLVTTFQQMTDDDDDGDDMQAMVSVSNLKDLIEQMQSESTVNFRQAKLYAPSPPSMSSSSTSVSTSTSNINSSNSDDLPLFSGPREEKPVEPLESTMSGDWDD